jgi:hypothetical protein
MRTYRLDVTNRDGIRVRITVRAVTLDDACEFAASNGMTDIGVYDWTAKTGIARSDAYYGAAAEDLS